MIENLNYFISAIVLISVIIFFLGLFKILLAKNDEQKIEGRKWMVWVSVLILIVIIGVAVSNQLLSPTQSTPPLELPPSQKY